METEPFETPLVVEGWIESGKAPVVMVTTGIEVSEQERDISGLVDNVIRYAKVSVEHDGVVYPLSARVSDAYMLKNYYTTGLLKGEVGGEYRLRVEWDGKTAMAVTRIPEPRRIGDLAVQPSPSIDSLFTIQATFRTDPLKQEYYKFFAWEKERQNGYAPSFLGTFDNMGRGEVIEYLVQKGVNYVSTEDLSLFFHKGSTVSVKLATMEPELFSFWRQVDQNAFCVTFPAVTFFSNVEGNVDGAKGYWAGYGIDEKEICTVNY